MLQSGSVIQVTPAGGVSQVTAQVVLPGVTPSYVQSSALVPTQSITVQSKPVSIVQVSSQPSPLIALPSSQASSDAVTPSPHAEAQVEPGGSGDSHSKNVLGWLWAYMPTWPAGNSVRPKSEGTTSNSTVPLTDTIKRFGEYSTFHV